MVDEDDRKIAYYYQALSQLARENKRWNSNINTYGRWSVPQRLWWIRYIEQQAAEGLPIAVELVSRALQIRMTK